MPATALIVDDEDATGNLWREVVAESGLRTKLAATTEQALDILDQSPIEIVITDWKVPQLGGIELLRRVKEADPQVADLAKRFLAALQRSVKLGTVFIASTLSHVFEQMKCSSPCVIVISNELVGDLPLTDILRHMLDPLIRIAPQQRQTEIAALVAEGMWNSCSGGRFFAVGCKPGGTKIALGTSPDIGDFWDELPTIASSAIYFGREFTYHVPCLTVAPGRDSFPPQPRRR